MKTIKQNITGIVAAATLTLLAAPAAQAMPMEYSFRTGGMFIGGGFGDIRSLSTTYNELTREFTWDAVINDVRRDDGSLQEFDGFMLVVNNQSSAFNAEETAVLFGDATNGLVTAHVYQPDGPNQRNFSYREPNSYIDTFDLDVSEFSITTTLSSGGSRTTDFNRLSFSINTDSIDNAFPDSTTWRGLSYDENIGFWFIPFGGSQYRYDPDGAINFLGFREFAVFDRFRPTNAVAVVPTPAPAFLLGLGLVGLLIGRKKRLRK